jgi:hypothetical protein
MIKPWIKLRVARGCGLAKTGFGTDVFVACAVGEMVGWLVAASLVAELVIVTSKGVSETNGISETCSMAGHLISKLIPYANPPRMAILRSENSNIPTGVMRIVQPLRRRCSRVGLNELKGSNELVISDREFYFTRCKKCARIKSDLCLP